MIDPPNLVPVPVPRAMSLRREVVTDARPREAQRAGPVPGPEIDREECRAQRKKNPRVFRREALIP
jgi:hypothetical protein